MSPDEQAKAALHAILANTQDAVASFDSEFRCLFANEAAARLGNQPASGMLGRTLWELVPQLPGSPSEEPVRQAVFSQQPLHMTRRNTHDGRWYELSLYPAAGGFNLFIRDVTAQKTMEEETRRVSTVLHDLPVALLIVDRNLLVEMSNPRAEELFGRPIHPGDHFESIRAGTLAALSGETLSREAGPVVATLRTGKPVLDFEVYYNRPDGAKFTLIVNCLPLPAPDASVRGVLITYTDVTSLRRAQAALAASEQRLRYLFNSPSIGVISGEGETITDSNDAFLAMVGYTRQDLLAGRLHWRALTVPEFAGRDQLAMEQNIARGFCDPYEKEYFAADGRRVPVMIGAVSLGPGTWTPWISWALDLSERRRFEERLRETARLESVGILAGGVAHDFNNLLTGILVNTSLAAESFPPDHPTRELLDHSLAITERATELTRQLLAYAGKGQFITRRVDLSSLVRSTIGIVRASVPKSIELRLRLAGDLPEIEADATQIQQIVMNLLLNASEAIGITGGFIDLETAAVSLDADDSLTSGCYVTLTVRDSGCGMDEETRHRVFDPFFTTKFTGRGLGLAASMGIARSHRGTIQVTSVPGEGSTFRLLLPAC